MNQDRIHLTKCRHLKWGSVQGMCFRGTTPLILTCTSESQWMALTLKMRHSAYWQWKEFPLDMSVYIADSRAIQNEFKNPFNSMTCSRWHREPVWEPGTCPCTIQSWSETICPMTCSHLRGRAKDHGHEARTGRDGDVRTEQETFFSPISMTAARK